MSSSTSYGAYSGIRFFGLIDLLAILSFYPGLDLRAVRAFRLLRLVRVLKLARYSAAAHRFHKAFLLAREEMIGYRRHSPPAWWLQPCHGPERSRTMQRVTLLDVMARDGQRLEAMLGRMARASRNHTQGCPVGAPSALGAPGLFISRSL
ncbi:MAG: hypothetical protein ACUVQI_04420 [Thermochromatium sp.]